MRIAELTDACLASPSMSRQLRIDFPDSWHHVMNRGARKEPIFHTSTDANDFLKLVGETAERFGFETHAYCLMTNHYHLLARSIDGKLSRAMQHIDGVYTQRYNWRHGHDGPLLRGRFHSILVDTDAYLASVASYIHRNPLDAGMVTNLVDHRWSSYPIYLGRRRPHDWLATSTISSLYANHTEFRQATERTPLPDDIQTFYSKPILGPVLGSDAFRLDARRRVEPEYELQPNIDRIEIQRSIERIVRVVSQVFEAPGETILGPSPGRRNIPRSAAIAIAAEDAGLSLAHVSSFFGLSRASSAGSASARFNALISTDDGVARQFREARTRLGIDDQPA